MSQHPHPGPAAAARAAGRALGHEAADLRAASPLGDLAADTATRARRRAVTTTRRAAG